MQEKSNKFKVHLKSVNCIYISWKVVEVKLYDLFYSTNRIYLPNNFKSSIGMKKNIICYFWFV